jgi:hypothetical protein
VIQAEWKEKDDDMNYQEKTALGSALALFFGVVTFTQSNDIIDIAIQVGKKQITFTLNHVKSGYCDVA